MSNISSSSQNEIGKRGFDDILKIIEKEQPCAQYVVVRNKKNSLRELCDFATRAKTSSPRARLKNLSHFPSFSHQYPSFDTSGTVIILESKTERNIMKKSSNDKILQVYSSEDHVKFAKLKYFKTCSFMLTTIGLCRKFATYGAPRAMTSFKNFSWKRVIVTVELDERDKQILKELFPQNVFIWYMVSEPNEFAPRVYDSPLPKHNVLVKSVQVCGERPCHRNFFWNDVGVEHSDFFMSTVRRHKKKQSTCAICLSKKTVDTITNCGHAYCGACITHAVQYTRNKCPTCKENVAHLYALSCEKSRKKIMAQIYGNRIVKNFLLAKKAKKPALVFAKKTDVELLNQLFQRHVADEKVKVVPTGISNEEIKYAGEKYVTIVYNSDVKKPNEYLQILAGTFGDVTQITNIFKCP
jgi:hypothetical protein